jgi:diguanylate cyclase (GGDEF)-like protein/PAS domain S-box-containing protein
VLGLIYFPFGVPSGHPRILGEVPWMEWAGQVPAWAVLGLSAVVAIFYGAHHYRPEGRLAWWLLGLSVLLFITGDTIYKTWHQLIGQQNIPFPSFIDAVYIAVYPVAALGLMLLNRARSRGADRTSLIDALIVTLGMALLSWIFLIGPNVRAPGDLLVRLTASAYPLGDVLLLAMLAHLWSGGGLRNPAGRLLALGVAGTLVADSVYGLAGLHPAWNWNDGNPFDLGWMLFYSCWGAAALHPSMRQLSHPRARDDTATGRLRLLLLALVSLIVPVVLIAQTVNHDSADAPVVAAASGVMFVLVLMRMSGLVTRQQEAAGRERILHRAAAALVAAPGKHEIYDAVLTALCELVPDPTTLEEVLVASRDDEATLRIVARSGVDDAEAALELELLPAPLRSSLTDGLVDQCVMAPPPPPTDGADLHRRVLFCPVLSGGVLAVLIVVKTHKTISAELTATLETLAAQIRLALDREKLAEVFHSRRSEARFQTVVQHASDVIVITRPDTTIVYRTPSAERILGYEPGSLEGRPLISLLHPADAERAVAALTGVVLAGDTPFKAEWRIRHRDGSWNQVEAVVKNLLADPTVEGVVVTMRDVSAQKGLEEELKHQAFHDALTGLPNRALFWDRLDRELARSARLGTSLAVLFIDLDDFKLVNDSGGHAAGDELLVALARRLSATLRDGDTAARLGGDEFAVLLEAGADAEASQLAERILDELQAPVTVGGREMGTHASIGIAVSGPGLQGAAELLQAADVAMYAAKAGGKGRFEVYQPELQTAITERLERVAELTRAVDEEQFTLHYQPIVRLDGRAIVGVEALIRWNHPERGLLWPKEFVTLAEETGLIIAIGRWALGEACANAARWQAAVQDRLKVNVNVSPRQFHRDGLSADVANALRESRLDPACLVLEITESLLVRDADAVTTQMLQLKLLGLSFAIDDFGTGYSSLSYLKRFPIDILKIDKCFVDDVGRTAQGGVLAETIIALGHSLDLTTVAEGIENEAQVNGLMALGCSLGQGFYFSRPITAAEMDRLLPSMASGEAFGAISPVNESVR